MARVAEAARRLAEAEWIRMTVKINSTEAIADCEGRQSEVGAGKVDGRTKQRRHSAERLRHAFGRFNDVCRSAFGERFTTRETAEFGMVLDQKAVDRPRAASEPIK
jgi:hypothetical protein